MRPRQGHDRTPAALGRTGQRPVAVLGPQEEAATVVVGPEEMDCEHSVDCTGGPLALPRKLWIDGGWIDGGWIDGGWIDGGYRLSQGGTPGRRGERVGEVLGLVRDGTVAEFHDADRVGGGAVIGDHAFTHPEVATALDPAHCEVALGGMPTALGADLGPAPEALAGLRVVQGGVCRVDRVLRVAVPRSEASQCSRIRARVTASPSSALFIRSYAAGRSLSTVVRCIKRPDSTSY